jgi:hypothetical protein
VRLLPKVVLPCVAHRVPTLTPIPLEASRCTTAHPPRPTQPESCPILPDPHPAVRQGVVLGKSATHVRDEGTVPRINKEEDPDPEYSKYLEVEALIPNHAKVCPSILACAGDGGVAAWG